MPNSLGNNNDNSISTKYRGLDPSYLGRLDINVCGTSDPGTSAILTPFCKTDGLYFDGSNEPESFKFNFDKDVTDYFSNDKFITVKPGFKSIKDYYDFNLECIEKNKEIVLNHKDRKEMYTIDINLDSEEIE